MCIEPARSRLARQRGISFVELIMFMVIVGIGLAGILNAMNLTARVSGDPLVNKQALMLAEGFMEEVQLARFTFCDATDDNVESATTATIGPTGCATLVENVGNEAGGTRPFDNVNDYVASFDTRYEAFKNADGNLSDAAEQPIDLPGYRVMLTVSPTSLLGSGAGLPQTEALRIRIEVLYRDIETPIVTLDGYRVRYAPNSPP